MLYLEVLLFLSVSAAEMSDDWSRRRIILGGGGFHLFFFFFGGGGGRGGNQGSRGQFLLHELDAIKSVVHPWCDGRGCPPPPRGQGSSVGSLPWTAVLTNRDSSTRGMNWVRREAYLLIEERQRAGKPLVDPQLIPLEKVGRITGR